MRSTKWTQIEKIQFQFTNHWYAKYSHIHQVLNIEYSNQLEDIEDLFLDDTRNAISTGSASTIKGKIISMVTSLKTDTNSILWTTILLNKFHMYTMEKEGDSKTINNDKNLKSIIKDSVKDNRDRLRIYLNIINMHFKPSFRPEISEDISEEPFPTSWRTSVSDIIYSGTGPGTQPPWINIL